MQKLTLQKIAKNIEDNARADADKKARNIITLAIQKMRGRPHSRGYCFSSSSSK